MARSLSPNLPQAANPLKAPMPPATATYPDNLLEKYKALVRQGYASPLSP